MTDQSAIHRVLSNPDKIAIMDFLATRRAKPASVTEIATAINVSQTWASKCLHSLQQVGLVERQREDQTVWNSIPARVVWPIVIWR